MKSSIACPRCGERADLLSATNEWRNYCPRCDIRFDDKGRVTGPDFGGFTPSELESDYSVWTAIVRNRMATLNPDVREWLGAWEAYDLAVSPMDDGRRGVLRLGHYLGWFGARPIDDRRTLETDMLAFLGVGPGGRLNPAAADGYFWADMKERWGMTDDELHEYRNEVKRSAGL